MPRYTSTSGVLLSQLTHPQQQHNNDVQLSYTAHDVIYSVLRGGNYCCLLLLFNEYVHNTRHTHHAMRMYVARYSSSIIYTKDIHMYIFTYIS